MPTCAVAVVDTQHSKDKNAIMQIFFISITFLYCLINTTHYKYRIARN